MVRQGCTPRQRFRSAPLDHRVHGGLADLDEVEVHGRVLILAYSGRDPTRASFDPCTGRGPRPLPLDMHGPAGRCAPRTRARRPQTGSSADVCRRQPTSVVIVVIGLVPRRDVDRRILSATVEPGRVEDDLEPVVADVGSGVLSRRVQLPDRHTRPEARAQPAAADVQIGSPGQVGEEQLAGATDDVRRPSLPAVVFGPLGAQPRFRGAVQPPARTAGVTYMSPSPHPPGGSLTKSNRLPRSGVGQKSFAVGCTGARAPRFTGAPKPSSVSPRCVTQMSSAPTLAVGRWTR